MSSQPTFRLSFIRHRIITLCQSRALRAALLAALNGGPDAGLVVEMVERVRPPARLPTQIVAPMSPREETSEGSEEETSEGSEEETGESSGEDTSEEETSGEERDTPGQGPSMQRSPPQGARDTVIIIDSESDNDRD